MKLRICSDASCRWIGEEKESLFSPMRFSMFRFCPNCFEVVQIVTPEMVKGLFEAVDSIHHIKNWISQDQDTLSKRQVIDSIVRMCDDFLTENTPNKSMHATGKTSARFQSLGS